LLSEVVYFEFTGGEPFLIEEHFELLRFAVESGFAKNIEIHYNTNATVFPEEAIEIWKHFKTVEIAFSIDNVGKRFEYERYGADWEEANRIVKRVNELRKEVPCIRTQVCLTSTIWMSCASG
jgi:MoaA/NifB/PqqE/SkfB family radical SAM enzyme